MSDDFDELELRLMREFLESASTTQWLVTALTMNYDGKSELIAWMTTHPNLDRATAAALFWYSQPGYYQRFRSEADVPSVNRAGWANVHALQDRVVSDTVSVAGASFDPANDLSTPTGNPKHPGQDWTAEALGAHDDPGWLISPVMFEPVTGDGVDIRGYVESNGWNEGMPPSVLDALEAAWRADEDEDEE
ncbi:DUF4274 domain-containing protein [Rhodococcus sp. OK302]|uniref:DUF4274 domain-containing protein n=1 Tax=Rhodococcus sp. OK302 TaxID=1882769 RepID=UPI000B9457AD|nr:DUF4274 domain-containing protein [Rhodococcus sp. OK302]OYD61028.1 uncharacterized protein DUF4274 [Rhodococcus sp. OK302]